MADNRECLLIIVIYWPQDDLFHPTSVSEGSDEAIWGYPKEKQMLGQVEGCLVVQSLC